MDGEALRHMLERVANGDLGIDEAARTLDISPAQDLGFATIDHHRAQREGLPEVILGQGKTPSQVARIAREIVAGAGRVLVTRVDEQQLAALREAIPAIEHNEEARLAWSDTDPRPQKGHVAVVSAGTSDIPVAEEAAITAGMMGAAVTRHYDIGVAGIHRITPHLEALRAANAVIVVAGMEGALPSVIGGLVANPVIATPTSVGYGASFGGLAALLGMLNTCAAGVAVVNIDNGFGAGYLAGSINRLVVGAHTAAGEGAMHGV
ncbi:MAG TPA: nickel pincer cofactor biosynthesis protein LarB [Tepidiformaceae bacterium]|nr:nickel pincer cofactor biosynthesis protein LarB [Tepidiformaceae bacterium]